MDRETSYETLHRREDAPPGSSWGVFGDDDQVGTVNRITPDCVRRAAALVTTGRTFNLDHPVNAFVPYPSGTRFPATHTIFSNHANHRDDHLDGYYLQGSSQVDGLRHARHPWYGFYNATPDDDVDGGGGALGVQALSQRGIAGRGVLLDVERHRASVGRAIDQRTNDAITVDDLVATAASQDVSLRRGDILLVRTGWTRHFLEVLDQGERHALPGALACPGLEQTREMVGWLWDTGFAVVAADNFALEAIPPVDHTHFSYLEPPGEPPAAAGLPAEEVEGLIHPQLIALLGMTIGEMWSLEALAEDCRADGRYEFLCVVSPLNLVGGVGSPSNATAIK